MSNLSTAYALSEIVPFLQRWLKGANVLENSNKITEIAKKITGQRDTIAMAKVLNSDANKMAAFQVELLNSFDELESNTGHGIGIQSQQSAMRGDIMVIAVSVSLCVYIYALTCCKDNLSGEVVGVLSTIAGIFGSCLKDAFSSEFRFKKVREEE